jgi:pimeloyl-ACP methyl ester carboxylesterase
MHGGASPVGEAIEFWRFPDKELEVVRAGPRDSVASLVFVHGVCHGAWCWEPFVEFFAARGYDALALSLRGHGASSGRRELHRFGLADYVGDVLDVIERLGRKPILVGHSMGGAIVQRYLATHGSTVSAAVLFASATAGGLGGQKFLDTVGGVGPRRLMNAVRIVGGRPSSPERANDTPFFSNRLSLDEAAKYAEYLGPESRRAVRDLLKRFTDIPTDLPPLMVIGSRDDGLFGEESQRATARAYGVTPLLLDGLCHDMMLDPDWELPAQHVLEFVRTVTDG